MDINIKIDDTNINNMYYYNVYCISLVCKKTTNSLNTNTTNYY